MAPYAGESVPASKSMGDRVFSGTIIDNGYIEVTADRVGDDTTFAKTWSIVVSTRRASAGLRTCARRARSTSRHGASNVR